MFDPTKTEPGSIAVAESFGRSREWALFALASNPYDGDFGDGSERVLDCRIAVAKRGGKCHGIDGTCERGVRKGELCLVLKMADSDGFYGGRFCVGCLDREWEREHLEDDEDGGSDAH